MDGGHDHRLGVVRRADRRWPPRRRARTAPPAPRSAPAGPDGARPGRPPARAARTGRSCARRTRRRSSNVSPNSSGTLMDTAAPAAQMTIASRSRRDRVSAAGLPVSPASTSCFHSRSECSRANSRDRSSRLPMRLTATRNASSARRPTAMSSSTEPRRWSSSSSASDWLQLPAALHVLTPLRELGLQLVLALWRRHAWPPNGIAVNGRKSPGPSQISLSASTTVSHWRRCSASSARPVSVMR